MTTRYSNGKVYKLVNTVDNHIYVGSTCTTLSKRFYNHKKQSSRDTHNARVYTHLNKVGWENVRIILIKNIVCKTKDNLLMCEQFYIDRLSPYLNTNDAFNHDRKFKLSPDKIEYKKQCKERTISYDDSIKQVKTDRKTTIKNNYIMCNDCNKKIYNLPSKIRLHEDTQAHKKNVNRSLNTTDDSKEHCCYECEKSFGTYQSLIKHYNSAKHKKIYDAMELECFGK